MRGKQALDAEAKGPQPDHQHAATGLGAPERIALEESAPTRAQKELHQAIALVVTSTALAGALMGLGAATTVALPVVPAFEAALVVALFAGFASRPASRRIREWRSQFPSGERLGDARLPKVALAIIAGAALLD